MQDNDAERAAWERSSLAARTFSLLAFREPEKMPRRVTAIQSYWPLTTLTKPFSAVCALPKLPRRFARPTRMPPLHALDTQALARPSGGGGGGRRRSVNEREKKEEKNKQNDILFLTNFLIGRQKGLARCPGRDVRLIPEKRGIKTKRDTWGRPLSRFLFFLFWHWISEQDGCLFAFSTRSPRRLWKQEEEDVGERHQNFSAVRLVYPSPRILELQRRNLMGSDGGLDVVRVGRMEVMRGAVHSQADVTLNLTSSRTTAKNKKKWKKWDPRVKFSDSKYKNRKAEQGLFFCRCFFLCRCYCCLCSFSLFTLQQHNLCAGKSLPGFSRKVAV